MSSLKHNELVESQRREHFRSACSYDPRGNESILASRDFELGI
jgi:hypothetical protein